MSTNDKTLKKIPLHKGKAMYTAFYFDSEKFHRTSGMSAQTWEQVTSLSKPGLFLEVHNLSGGDIRMRFAGTTPTGTEGRLIPNGTVKTFTGALPSTNCNVYIYGASAPNNVEFSWS